MLTSIPGYFSLRGAFSPRALYLPPFSLLELRLFCFALDKGIFLNLDDSPLFELSELLRGLFLLASGILFLTVVFKLGLASACFCSSTVFSSCLHSSLCLSMSSAIVTVFSFYWLASLFNTVFACLLVLFAAVCFSLSMSIALSSFVFLSGAGVPIKSRQRIVRGGSGRNNEERV